MGPSVLTARHPTSAESHRQAELWPPVNRKLQRQSALPEYPREYRQRTLPVELNPHQKLACSHALP
jgi:hypothetical protein